MQLNKNFSETKLEFKKDKSDSKSLLELLNDTEEPPLLNI